MEKYDVIAISEASRGSETSHIVQSKYFKLSGIKYFTCEALGPIECYVLNKYKDPKMINLFTLTGFGTRTQMLECPDVIFIPTDYYALFIKSTELLKLLPPLIAAGLVIAPDGRVVKYNDPNDTLHGDELLLHLNIKKALGNNEDRYKFWARNIVEFIEHNRLFIVGYRLSLHKFDLGSLLKDLKGDKFISIGMGALTNFQMPILRKLYTKKLEKLDIHFENMHAPDAQFTVDNVYKYINLTRFEKSLDIKEQFIWTNKLSSKSTFHIFPFGYSPYLLGKIVKPSKYEDSPTVIFTKYTGFEVPVDIYDAIIFLKESIYNADMSI